MKKHSIGSRMLSTLLVLAMTLSILPTGVFAAVGDLSNVDTGLTGDIDTTDTISLPIKILDYEADGMLFEFAEAYAGVSGVKAAKTAGDFGATWYEDYTIRTSVGGSVNTGNYWSDVSLALKTGTYANYTRLTFKGTTTANWTGNRAGVVLADFSESSTYTTDQVRYMVVVFRSNVRSGNFTVGLNRANLNDAGTNGNYTGNIAVTTENNTNWTYAVLDLKTGTLGSNWSKGAVYGVYVGLPIDASGEWMDLAHVAFFSDKDQATAFGEYALTDGSDRGDNRGFGLLRGSRTQSGGTAVASIIDSTSTLYQIPWDEDRTLDLTNVTNLGYSLLGTFAKSNIANIGFLESAIGPNGYPVYKEEVVTYLATLLEKSLEIPERDEGTGWKNYRYVKGTASTVYGGTDLATALRTRINGTTGSYSAASAKDLVGTWAEVNGNITSYYDAAYFLLNSIFVPGSYNVEQDDYEYLVLSAGTDKTSGDKVYVFDGGFSTSSDPDAAEMAIDYNTTKHTIQNTSAAGKAHFVYEGVKTTTLNPFLPVTDRNTIDGMTKTPYYQDDGVLNSVKKQETKDTLYKKNYNFAMVSEGEFVYHVNDELFFEFEGDDDVYLFINNELVMDIGSAHSIDSVRFNLNDYVNAAKAGNLGSDARNKALSLEEGNTYSFKFYYMERHSYGSNIRICTNIRVTDPSMETKKTAWQDEVQLSYGSVINKAEVVEYGFSIKNNGQENLYNLTFTDNDIGVTLDYTNGLTVTNEDYVSDVNGDELTASDLKAVITHPNYNDINVTFADNQALKDFLKDLTAEGTEEGGGLYIGATVLIRGIGYTLTSQQIEDGYFDNVVLTTSTNYTESEKLQASDKMLVYVPSDPMYYQWAGHELKVSLDKLISDITNAVTDPNNPLHETYKDLQLTTANVNSIELCTKNGTVYTDSHVTASKANGLVIKYEVPGTTLFYIKITYSTTQVAIIPVVVNITAVVDSVIVLDYGLPVELTSLNNDDAVELTKNDYLVVPGRGTTFEILGIGSNGAYSPNEITFTKDADGIIEGKYGTFTLDLTNQKLTYKPTKFIEGVDTIQIAYTVYEHTTPSRITGTLDINNEVEMYKNITIVPANVMYYEDDFTGDSNGDGTVENVIKYTEDANIDNSAETDTDIDTTTTTTLRQSADQEMNYGYDPVYARGDNQAVSGDSVHKILLDGSDDITFSFKGTGFELIGRTDAVESGTIVVGSSDDDGSSGNGNDTEVQMEVEVISTYPASEASGYSMSGETTYTSSKIYPVIMEFDNGDDGGEEVIYQVPVIRIDGLDPDATHKVTITGIQAHDWTVPEDGNTHMASGKEVKCGFKHIDTYFYFDGLRIFQPMTAADSNKYYDDDEQSAVFKELRSLIGSGDAVVASYDIDKQEVKIGTGTTVVTWTEDYTDSYNKNDVVDDKNNNVVVPVDGWTVNKVTSVDEYLLEGPNNEVYMLNESAAGVKSGIFFYVKETGTAEVESSLQLAVRALDFGSFHGANAEGLHAPIQYNTCTVDADGNTTYAWTDLELVQSGTEQYYKIDYTKCPNDKENGYMVALRIFEDTDEDTYDDNYFGMASYSSLKLTGKLQINESWMLTDTAYEYGTFVFTNGIAGETTTSSGSADSGATYTVANAFIDQLKSNIIVTGENNAVSAPTTPEIDDPFQDIADKDNSKTDPDDTDDNTTPEEESRPSNFDLLNLFSLTAIAGEGGTITPEGDLVIAFGASRTFRFIPDEGYEIADVLVNGVSVGAVDKYVLKAAHADTVVEVIFREIPAESAEETPAEEAAG